MRDSVSSENPNTEKGIENKMCNRVFYEEIRGVWIADETLARVFVISSQSKQGVNREVKLSKSMVIKTGYPNIHQGYFLHFNLMNYCI